MVDGMSFFYIQYNIYLRTDPQIYISVCVFLKLLFIVTRVVLLFFFNRNVCFIVNKFTENEHNITRVVRGRRIKNCLTYDLCLTNHILLYNVAHDNYYYIGR